MHFGATIHEPTCERLRGELGSTVRGALRSFDIARIQSELDLEGPPFPSRRGAPRACGRAALVGSTPCEADDAELVTPGSPTSRILLMLDELNPRAPAVYWLKLLAAAFTSCVEVCRVDARASSRTPPRRGRDGFEAQQRRAPATLEALRWCRSMLPEALVLDRVISVGDHYVADAAALIRQRSIDWIVISARGPDCGARAAAVARATGRPVLVARPPTARPALLIATDSHVDNFPVLRRAVQLMSALRAPAIAFHAIGKGRSDDLFPADLEALVEPWVRIQSQQPSTFGGRLPTIDLRLDPAEDRAGSILAQARLEDAGMILIGLAGADRHLAPITGSGAAMASTVVDRAARSVLLVPPEVTGRPCTCHRALPRCGSGLRTILADRRRWRISDVGRRRPFDARCRGRKARTAHPASRVRRSIVPRALPPGVTGCGEPMLRHATFRRGSPRPRLRRRRV
jgi:hypothetical protein